MTKNDVYVVYLVPSRITNLPNIGDLLWRVFISRLELGLDLKLSP